MARNKYPEKTRQAILESAVKLFTIRGWEKVTIQEVIDDVGGITRGAFYHHFKSKSELIDAVTQEYFSENKQLMSYLTQTNSTAIERLQQGIMFTLKKQTEKDSMSNIPSVINSPEFVFRIVHDSIEITSKEIAVFIKEGNKDGSCHVLEVTEVSEMMLLLLNIWINPNIIKTTKDKYIEKITFFDKMLKALGLPLFDDELRVAFSNYYEESKK
ncbi:MAG: TetR/AcrR family transcriptional regulator [Vagococcus sp.]|uniref:TetR/AcrR family transcriptional regulator n=1 Tax=Vagococcus sp. TaxID=1933889 RepID=UPI002FC85CD0